MEELMQGYNCIVIFNAGQNRILMCERQSDPYKGKLNVVGGKIERDANGVREDGFAAAYRELAEETGITPDDIVLNHMMDFTYYNQDCYVEVYVGTLPKASGGGEGHVQPALRSEKHPLVWVPLTENFFDLDRFAGEGNIGHMLEQVKVFGCGVQESRAAACKRAGAQEPYTILCFGDSNTFGYNPMTQLRYPESIRWPKLLQAKLDAASCTVRNDNEPDSNMKVPTGRSFRVIEEGCNGRTAAYIKEDEPWKYGLPYLKPCLNTHKPVDLMILMLGSNDLKKMFPADPEEIASRVKELIDTAQEFTKEKQGFAPQILLISPPEIGPAIAASPFAESFDEAAIDRSKAFARLYKRIAEKTGCSFLDAASVTGVLPADSLHLMPDDHARLADAVYSMVCRIYTRTQSR